MALLWSFSLISAQRVPEQKQDPTREAQEVLAVAHCACERIVCVALAEEAPSPTARSHCPRPARHSVLESLQVLNRAGEGVGRIMIQSSCHRPPSTATCGRGDELSVFPLLKIVPRPETDLKIQFSSTLHAPFPPPAGYHRRLGPEDPEVLLTVQRQGGIEPPTRAIQRYLKIF
jgi:hypothetical protein